MRRRGIATLAVVVALGCNGILGFERGELSQGGLPCKAPGGISGHTVPECDNGQLCMFDECQKSGCKRDSECPTGSRCMQFTGASTSACVGGDSTCMLGCPQQTQCSMIDGRCRTFCGTTTNGRVPCLDGQYCGSDNLCYGSDPRYDAPLEGGAPFPDASSD